VVPHLPAGHSKDKDQSQQSPSVLVLQEFKIVSPEIKHSTNHKEEHKQSCGASVIRGPVKKRDIKASITMFNLSK